MHAAILPFDRVVNAIEDIAQRYPNRIALRVGGHQMSYAELDRRADELAEQLRSEGIGSGMGVAIRIERSLSLFVAILGILKSGAAYIPLDLSYPELRLQFVLRDTGAPLLYLSNPAKPNTSAFTLAPPLSDASAKHMGDAVYVIYTSGSTGQPKGVIVSHSNLTHAAQDWLRYFDQSFDVFLLLSSVMFDSSVMGIFLTWLSGGTLVVPTHNEEKDPERLRQLIAQYRVTHTLCLPSLHSLLLNHPAAATALSSLRTIIVAGEVCPPALTTRHYALLPQCVLYNGYGPTETTVHATTYRIPPYFEGKNVPIGKALRGTYIYLLDGQQCLVPDGEIGEMYIGGKGVSKGYLNRPDLTANRFLPNPFADGLLYRTGDLARFLPDGNLEFVGRNDRQIKLRGYRIELDEIENALLQLPDMRQAAVVCAAAPNGEAQIVAYIAQHPNSHLNTTQYRKHLIDLLPDYMLPTRWIVLDQLPLAPNGKIDRTALSEQAARPTTTTQIPTTELPRNELEQYIADLWCDILSLPEVGIHDKFFEIGGTSISAAQFAARLQNVLQETVFIVTLFDNPTVAQYAQFLTREYDISKLWQHTTEQAATNTNTDLVPIAIVPNHIAETNLLSNDTTNTTIQTTTNDKKNEKENDSNKNEATPKPIIATRDISTAPNTDNLAARLLPYLPYTTPQSYATSRKGKVLLILAPPRSGTSLLSLILDAHPNILAANELQLLHFQNLTDRQHAYTGKFSLWLDGNVRTLMNLLQCDANTAQTILQQQAAEGMTTAQQYQFLQNWAGNCLISDKTTSYALHPEAMLHAEAIFEHPIYIHLVRHPYAMVRSFERQKMHQAMYIQPHPFSPRELGEAVWQASHANISTFLQHIPQNRQFTLYYETLVTQPEATLRALCQQMGLPFDPKMLQPYEHLAQTNIGASQQYANAMTDPKLLQQTDINPALAEVWKEVEKDNFLQADTWNLYHSLSANPIAPISNISTKTNAKNETTDNIENALEGENELTDNTENALEVENEATDKTENTLEVKNEATGKTKNALEVENELTDKTENALEVENEAIDNTANDIPTNNPLSHLEDKNADCMACDDEASLSHKIAIIGLAGSFPSATDIGQFWHNLFHGIDGGKVVTDADLQHAGLPLELLNDNSYVKRSYCLDDPKGFDADFFGYLPREVETMDPQHRVLLECAYHALENAGYTTDNYEGIISIFGGIARNAYLTANLATHPDLLAHAGDYALSLGAEKDFAITRVAYKLNLKGGAINIQTACSTGGTALYVAAQSILAGDCDLALVCGGRIEVPSKVGYHYVEGAPLSPDGYCRAFDADAKGMVRGSGMVCILLKRADQSLADRDTIYATINGIGISNDGADKIGFTAPSVKGQVAAIVKAHQKAGICSDDISYVEAHGTGTLLGDPIEIAALSAAFAQTARQQGMLPKQYCAIGSVKTNIGHLDAGACLAGILKTALSLRYHLLPQSLHFRQYNPQIPFDKTPFYVQQALTRWTSPNDKPLYAGINSLGLGGTNVHIVLQEPPALPDLPTLRRHRLLLLSAKTETALSTMTQELSSYLHNMPDLSLADAAYTLQIGRQHHHYRRFAVLGEADNHSDQLPFGNIAAISRQKPRVAFMFAGGGAQYSGMGAGLYAEEPVFKTAIDQCADILRQNLATDIDLCDLLYTPDAATRYDLEKPTLALVSLFATEYALAQLWQSWGLMPAALIGHSAGEYAAACIAQVMRLEDALALVLMRGCLFELLPEGGMLNIPLSEADLRRYDIDVEYDIAAVNQEGQCVVSGSVAAMEHIAQYLAAYDIETKRVPISVAAHSRHVADILPQFTEFVRSLPLKTPAIPFVSNLSGTWITDEEACSADYWVQHLRQTVRFADGLQTLLRLENTILLEIAPGQTLSAYARRHPNRNPQLPVLSAMRHPRDPQHDAAFAYKTLGQLWQIGYPISWNGFNQPEAQALRRVPLPCYPFEHKTYRIPPRKIDVVAPKHSPILDTNENKSTATNDADTSQDKNCNEPLLSTNIEPSTYDIMPTSRIPLIAAEIQRLFHEQSGMPLELMDIQATFLELGFDSLFMTQAVAVVNKRMGAKVQFRQLFEEATTIAELAELLDRQIAPTLFAQTQQLAEITAANTIAQRNGYHHDAPANKNGNYDSSNKETAQVSGRKKDNDENLLPQIELQQQLLQQLTQDDVNALSADGLTALERVIAQQLQVMQQQLLLLAGGSVRNFPTDEKKNKPLNPAPSQQAANDEQYVKSVLEKTIAQATVNDTQSVGGHAHGPWKPVDKKNVGISDHQGQCLQNLIERYTKRTNGSKRLANSQRRHLADARSITGFNKLWKEMTYQIAVERSAGSKIWDVDNNEYIDFVMGFGINFFGHNPQFAQDAILAQLPKGVHLGVLTPLAKEVADLICQLTGMERAMFVNTGSEGVSAAVRAARTVTGKSRIAVFEGDYHGIADELLVKGVKVGGKTLSRPVSPGIPQFLVDNMLVLDYDDPNLLAIIRQNADDLAAIVLEPLTAQNPHIQRFDLLHQLRSLCTECDIALVFDELITGFRLHPRGAQGWFDVEADICSYGKIICGGLPMAAVAGKSRFMDVFDGGAWQFGDDSFPAVGVTFFGGTFVRHPLCLATAKAALQEIMRGGEAIYDKLNERTAQFAEKVRQLLAQYRAPIAIYSTASIVQFKITDNQLLSRLFFFLMREKGVHVTERGGFTSTAHNERDLERVLQVIEMCLIDMRESDFFRHDAQKNTDDDVSKYGIIVPSPNNTLKKKHGTNDLNAQDSVLSSDSIAQDQYYDTANSDNTHHNDHSIMPHNKNKMHHDQPIALLDHQLPLTEAQQEVWLGNEMEAHSAAGYNLTTAFCFDGILQVDILHQALQQLIARHDALRTSFDRQGLYQTVANSVKIDLPFVQLSHLRSDEEVPYQSRSSDTGAEQWAFNTQQAAALRQIQAEEIAQLFDLHQAPLMRVRLVGLDATRHILLLTTHHIVADGWSVGILVAELCKLYTALAKGEAHSLPEAPQFANYARLEYNNRHSEEVRSAEQYWLGKLSGELPILELPTDRPRPPLKTYNAAFEKIVLSPEQFLPLKQVAAKSGATLFAFTLAAFKAFLNRISAQNEFIIGVIAAGQSTSGNSSLVGHCVSLLPLYANMDDKMSFATLLKTTRSEVLDMFQYYHCTFNTLLKKLKYRRDAGHQPIISVVFNMDSTGEALHFEGLQTQSTAIPRHYETYDIFFNVKQMSDQLSLEWVFNTDLFDRSTVQLRLQEFATLLQGAAQNGQQSIAQLPILPPTEQHLLLQQYTDTAVATPQNVCIHQLIEQQVSRTPQRVAAACMDDTITYNDLNRRANQLAHYLIGRGVGRNVPVGILIDRSIDMLIATLAVLKAGGTYVPLEGQNNPIERLALIADDAAIQFLLTRPHSVIKSPEALIDPPSRRTKAVIDIEYLAHEIAQQPDTNPKQILATDSIAYIIYTSGSTAKPKGVIITHASAVDFLHCFGIYPGLYETDTVFAVASLSFDPSVQDLFLPLMKGGRVYIATHETIMNGQLFKQELKRSGATLIQATPATWNMLLSVGWEGDKQLRVMSGGEGLTRELAEQLADKTAELWNIYGPTETTVWTTARKITTADFEGLADFARKIGYLPVGKPIPNTFVYVLDQHLQAVPIGVPGEICIGGPGVMVGYLNRPDLNKAVLVANPYHHSHAPLLYRTGDIGRWLPNGDIEYLHRADNQVKIRGYRIELGEIESIIAQYAPVRQNVVVVRTDANGQKRLVAYIITQQNQALNLANLRLFLQPKLPEYMIPAAFVQMESFPLTSTLKVNRRALPEPELSNTPETDKQHEAPRTQNEISLTEMWQELLNLPQISINDNFFELGGHSLIAVTMMARITKLTGKTLPLATLLEYPTIKKLAGLLDGNEAAKWDCLVPVKTSGNKVPIYIVHGAGLHVLLFNTLADLMCADQPVYALQAHGLNGIDRPYDCIEDIAAHYVSEIVRHNPNGPYALAGYSFGGTIAFEMAKQLTNAGRTVTLVGLLDTVAPVDEPESNLEKMMLLGKKVGAALGAIVKDPLPSLQYRANNLQRSFHRLKAKIGVAEPDSDSTADANYLVDEMNSRAYDNYRLSPYKGKLHLFRAESRRYYVADTEYLGWQPYAQQGVTVIDIKGDHHTLFSHPHNIEFAKRLQSCLDEVHSNIKA